MVGKINIHVFKRKKNVSNSTKSKHGKLENPWWQARTKERYQIKCGIGIVYGWGANLANSRSRVHWILPLSLGASLFGEQIVLHAVCMCVFMHVCGYHNIKVLVHFRTMEWF